MGQKSGLDDLWLEIGMDLALGCLSIITTAHGCFLREKLIEMKIY